MGFWLFAGIELVYLIFFILIVIFSTMAFSATSDAKDSSTDPKDKTAYQKAIDMLGWCIGIGYTIIALAVIAIIVAAVAAFFAGPEAAVAAEATAGGSELFGLGSIIAEANQFKTVLGAADFSKLEGVLNFAKNNAGKILNLTQKTDKLYTDLKQTEKGLLGYNKVFGMSGIFGTIEKVILWSTAVLLFVISVLAAVAAGYISRTSTKAGYDSAITAAIVGIVPFSIMFIWGISNAIWLNYKLKAVNADEIAIYPDAKPLPPAELARQAKIEKLTKPSYKQAKEEQKQAWDQDKWEKKQAKIEKKYNKPVQQPKSSKSSPARQGPPPRQAPPPPRQAPPARQGPPPRRPPPPKRAPPPPPVMLTEQESETEEADILPEPPHHHTDIHPSDSYDIPTNESLDDILTRVKHQSPKTTAQQGVDIAQTVVKHADQAHQILTSLKGSVDPNSTQGQLLSNATDILGTIKGHKDTVDSIGRAVNAA